MKRQWKPPLRTRYLPENGALVFIMDKPEPSGAAFAPLISCPACAIEMRLLGIEAENPTRDLYTFECGKCRRLEVRGLSAV